MPDTLMPPNVVVPTIVEMQDYDPTYLTPDRHHTSAPMLYRGFSRSMSYLPRLNYTVTDPLLCPHPPITSPAPSHAVFSDTATRISNYSEPDLSNTECPVWKTLSHGRILPYMPENSQRYNRGVTVPRTSNNMRIPALTTNYHTPDPAGVRRFSHPEGIPYFSFFHEGVRIFTDANLLDNTIMGQLTKDIDILFDCLRANNIQLASCVDLVLDLGFEADGGLSPTGYYFADHQKRLIFFLDDVYASSLLVWESISGVSCYDHLAHEIEAQYWWHIQLFPMALQVSEWLLNEVRDTLTFWIGDVKTSRSSVAAYSLAELQDFQSSVDGLKRNLGNNFCGATCTISTYEVYALLPQGRVMFNFARQRFYNFHGQPAARLQRGQSVHDSNLYKRSRTISLISALLFCSPNVHLRDLKNIYTDGAMNDAIWKQYIEKLRSDWQAITLYATFLLAVNVAFLAIQSVDVNKESYRSPTQIFSYLSAISSTGSIALSLITIRKSWENIREDVKKIVHSRPCYEDGLEILAIRFSLPFALIMWGLFFLIIAFWIMCFNNANLSTIIVVGVFSLILALIIIWSILLTWERPAADSQAESWRSRCMRWLTSDQTTLDKKSLFHRVSKWPMLFRRKSSPNLDDITLAGGHHC